MCVDGVDGGNDVNCDQGNCNDGPYHHEMIKQYVFVLYCFHCGAMIVLSICFDFYFRFVFCVNRRITSIFITVSLNIAGQLINQVMI